MSEPVFVSDQLINIATQEQRMQLRTFSAESFIQNATPITLSYTRVDGATELFTNKAKYSWYPRNYTKYSSDSVQSPLPPIYLHDDPFDHPETKLKKPIEGLVVKGVFVINQAKCEITAMNPKSIVVDYDRAFVTVKGRPFWGRIADRFLKKFAPHKFEPRPKRDTTFVMPLAYATLLYKGIDNDA